VNDCPPRNATPRTSRRTYGPQVAEVARRLGWRLLPWQRLALSVGLEQAGRRPAYRDCLVSICRQQGKSSMALALIVWRMTTQPGARVAYTAQTRLSARERLLRSWWPRLERAGLAEEFTLSRAYGAETLTHVNGAVLQLLSSAETAGHGETIDLAVVDEAWVHTSAALEQALRPAMLTRPAGQLWAMSTAGTARSVWWRQKLDAARTSAELGVTDGGSCLLEWAANPDDDPADEAVWWRAMPALGRTVDVATVRQDLANMGPAEFKRAMLNLWPDEASSGWHLIDKATWEASAL
jgi:phage terminase large subunit-like protein